MTCSREFADGDHAVLDGELGEARPVEEEKWRSARVEEIAAGRGLGEGPIVIVRLLAEFDPFNLSPDRGATACKAAQ